MVLSQMKWCCEPQKYAFNPAEYLLYCADVSNFSHLFSGQYSTFTPTMCENQLATCRIMQFTNRHAKKLTVVKTLPPPRQR